MITQDNFYSLTTKQAEKVVKQIKKDRGELKLYYGSVDIAVLSAFFAANSYKWNGYLRTIAAGNSTKEAALFSEKNPTVVSVTKVGNVKPESYQIVADNTKLFLKVNDGKPHDNIDLSTQWIQSQILVYGDEIVDKMRKGLQEDYRKAAIKAEQAKKLLNDFEKIAASVENIKHSYRNNM